MLGVRSHCHFNLIYKVTFIQGDSRGKVNILVCDSISHRERKSSYEHSLFLNGNSGRAV